VPELAKMPNKFLQNPWEAPSEILSQASVTLGITYPKPMVDHKIARDKAMEAYGVIKSN